MAGIAKITLVGNLGRDPETRYTPNGRMNVQFTMAVSWRFTDQSGQQQERTNWFRVTAWGRLAETMDRMAQNGYLTKGKQVFVEGRFEAREYQDQQGQTRTSLDVNATELLLLGSRADSEGGFGGGYGAGAAASSSRPQGRYEQNDEPRRLEEVPWDDDSGEPPF
ncbi:MAG: single-stranded DNA-binding protein [Thermomicrobiales bacterium]|nr:single-stranded DNA-binding protein [Thermomicrobiales bacterium]